MTLDPKWVCGFVDGEGCFTVCITAQPSMTIGFQVLPEFVVVQHERDIELLHDFVSFFQCGKVCPNHGERKCYRVRALDDLNKIIIPFFKSNPLQTKKSEDFEKFCQIIEIMNSKEHTTDLGLASIRSLTFQMNNRKKKLAKQKKTEIIEFKEDFLRTMDET